MTEKENPWPAAIVVIVFWVALWGTLASIGVASIMSRAECTNQEPTHET